MAIIGWLFVTAISIFFIVSGIVGCIVCGVLYSKPQERLFPLIGVAIGLIIMYISYNSCPFTIQLN